MPHYSDRRNILLFGIAHLAVLGVASLLPASWELPRLCLILITLLYSGYLIGTRLFPVRTWLHALLPGTGIALGLQSIAQTTFYYLDIPLNATTDLLALSIVVLCSRGIAFALTDHTHEHPNDDTLINFRTTRNILLGGCLALFAFATTSWAMHAIANAGTTESIRTPWPLLPSGVLWAVAAGWATLACSIWIVRSRIAAAIHASLALLPTLTIASLVYRIGYGFDGFLHIASEKILLTTGTLHPKPFYYIGQYVFCTWLARLSHVSVADIDRWLVPIGAAVILPLAILSITPRHTDALSRILILGCMPLGIFIATTPQSFAYLLGLLALLLASASTSHRIHPLAALTIATWSIAVHPLAGIPFAFATIALLATHLTSHATARIIRVSSIILAIITIPVLFYVLGQRGGTPIHWNVSALLSLDPWRERFATLLPFVGNRFALWPAWASLAPRLLPLGLLIFAITGKQRTLVWCAVGIWLSGTILRTASEFTFLIEYERSNYADRLTTIALLCLIPAALPSLETYLTRLRQSPIALRGLTFLFFVALATGTAYDALPRNDAFVTGRGWSTSRADVDAVTWIDRDAHDEPYTVLANQSVSAAAVALLGFKRYAGDVFFYPIPTGGPLYELYLRMTYNEPSRDTARDAAAIGGSRLVYVVVNNYWWRASELAESLGAISDRTWDIEQGKIRIYRFDMSTSSSTEPTSVTP